MSAKETASMSAKVLELPCPTCDGTGTQYGSRVESSPCPHCRGEGVSHKPLTPLEERLLDEVWCIYKVSSSRPTAQQAAFRQWLSSELLALMVKASDELDRLQQAAEYLHPADASRGAHLRASAGGH